MFIKCSDTSIFFGLVLIFIISTFTPPMLCQEKKFAIVSNPVDKGKIDINALEHITNELNKFDDISDVFIIGNLTLKGSEEEFIIIKNIFENLRAPYHIVAGYNDYSDTPLGSKNILSVFDDEEFTISKNNFTYLGINSIIPGINNNGLIKIETLNKILENSDSKKFNNIVFLFNQELDLIQNRFDLFNIFDGKNILVFTHSLSSNNYVSTSKDNITEIKIPFSTDGTIRVSFFEENNDSLFIYHLNTKEKRSDLKIKISLSEMSGFNKLENTTVLDSSIELNNKIEYKSSTYSNLITDDVRIFITLNNGLVYCLDNKGKEKFVTEIMGTIFNNSILYKDLFLAATIEGDLYSINSNNGNILQVVGIGENITTDLSVIDVIKPGYKGKAVVLGTSEGNVYCYDAFTFELLWKQNISKLDVIAKPEVIGDKIILQSNDVSLYCLSAKSGILTWKLVTKESRRLNLKQVPVSDGERVFSFSSNEELISVDLLVGKKIWSAKISDAILKLYLSSNKEKLYTINKKGLFSVFSTNEGKNLNKIDLRKDGIFSFCLTEYEDELFVGFSDGSVYSFDENFKFKELISANFIPIISLDIINTATLAVLDANGKLSFYYLTK